jgi:hypothetical protein
VGDIYHDDTPCRVFDPVNDSPISDSVSQQMGKIPFETLDVVVLSRVRAKDRKAPIQSSLQISVGVFKKAPGVGREDQVVRVNTSAGVSQKG